MGELVQDELLAMEDGVAVRVKDEVFALGDEPHRADAVVVAEIRKFRRCGVCADGDPRLPPTRSSKVKVLPSARSATAVDTVCSIFTMSLPSGEHVPVGGHKGPARALLRYVSFPHPGIC